MVGSYSCSSCQTASAHWPIRVRSLNPRKNKTEPSEKNISAICQTERMAAGKRDGGFHRGLAAGCLGTAVVFGVLSTRGFLAAGPILGQPLQRSFSLVLCADNGQYIGGFGEGSILMEAAQSVTEEVIPSHCASVYRVVFSGQPAFLVTTGIGDTRAALCLESVLRVYGPMLKEVLFLGTSGGSPAIGGIVDSAHCDAPEPPGPATDLLPRLVGLGDVCVSPASTTFDCQRCFWAHEPYGSNTPPAAYRSLSACASPPCSLHERWDIFGEFGCSFFFHTDLAVPPTPSVPRALPPFRSLRSFSSDSVAALDNRMSSSRRQEALHFF